MDEKRALTQQEKDELNQIQREMQEQAIKTLSASEKEQIAIKETMRREKGKIDAKTASETVKRSAEARDGVIKEANKQYEDVVATATYQAEVLGTITKEEADEIIKQAGYRRDETVNHAKAQHRDVVREAKDQAKEHVREVDWETGEIKSKWRIAKEDISRTAREMWGELKSHFSDGWADLKRNTAKGVDGLRQAVANGAAGFHNALASLWNGGAALAETALRGIANGMNWVIKKFGGKGFNVNVNIDRVKPIQSKYQAQTGTNSRGIAHMYAKGTKFHPGGPAIVGDGGMKELILHPNGHMALSPDTDTLLDLPRGTQVASGPDTKKIMEQFGIPGYKFGIGNVLDTLKSWGSSVWEWAAGGAKKVVSNVLGKIGLTSAPSIAGFAGDILSAGWGTLKSNAVSFIKKGIETLGAVGPGSMNFGGLRFTSGFGPRKSPGGIGSTNHQGVDLAGPLGTTILSQTGGLVTESGFNRFRGNYVKIKQGMYAYVYQHLLRNLVGRGAGVSKGQPIGLLGSTGASTGPHLHFEVHRNGTPINPLPFIGKFASGGLINKQGLYELAEDGFPEFVIPTDPAKRTEAQKLLALAAKQIQGNKRPNQLPNPGSGSGGDSDLLRAVLEQNEILRMILDKDLSVNILRDRLAREVNEQNALDAIGGFF